MATYLFLETNICQVFFFKTAVRHRLLVILKTAVGQKFLAEGVWQVVRFQLCSIFRLSQIGYGPLILSFVILFSYFEALDS